MKTYANSYYLVICDMLNLFVFNFYGLKLSNKALICLIAYGIFQAHISLQYKDKVTYFGHSTDVRIVCDLVKHDER